MWVNENVQPALGLGWSKEETEVFLAAVRKDFNDTRIHAYWEMYEA
jgi:hypothetical protein